ncbi:high-affinity nickel transporter [Salmonella enterica subsp. enterica]|uniref:High-affinity nickel transporter n=1 Tax=Salmonella enterica I TaxID=59201 RepID=A0A379WQM0_SALET|nr:high-affinity nickel transporter [Salmonella enterica subsp. enterica]
MIVLSMGMRPCSGAIMVLLFSKVIGVLAGNGRRYWQWRRNLANDTSLALLVHTFVLWR